MKPWEAYQPPEQDGPWTRYAKPEPTLADKGKSVGLSLLRGINSGGDFIEQLVGKVIPAVGDAVRTVQAEDNRTVQEARDAAGFTGTDVSRIAGSIISPASVAAAGTFPVAGAGTILGAAARGAGQGGVYAAMQPVANPDEMLTEKGRQIVEGVKGGAIGGAVGGGLGKWMGARKAASEAAKAAHTTQDAAAVAAREAGYTLPPVTTNPTLGNRMAEGLAGKLTTAQQASMKNQQVTNSLVRKALGMADDAPITKEALAALRKNEGAAYEAVASVPQQFAADKPFRAAIEKLREQSTSTASAFKSLDNPKLQTLLDDLSADAFDPRVAVEASKQLRFEASRVLGSPMAAPADLAVARAQKRAAVELEELIARNLRANGMPELHTAWQVARSKIAKIKNVEKALNDSTGNVVAPKLAQQMKKGSPLSGELRTVAQAAEAFPKATREITESMPGISPLDYFAGGAMGAASGNPALFMLPLARPVARSAILSPAYQRAFGAPSYAAPVAGALSGPMTPRLSALLGGAYLTSQ